MTAVAVHASFENPTAEPDAKPRESVEIRALVIDSTRGDQVELKK